LLHPDGNVEGLFCFRVARSISKFRYQAQGRPLQEVSAEAGLIAPVTGVVMRLNVRTKAKPHAGPCCASWTKGKFSEAEGCADAMFKLLPMLAH
jgi:hypothetical protein